jgi:hypothetical protein
MLFTESGISEEVIAARGYVTVTDRAEARQLGFGKAQALAPALLIPLWTVDGEVSNYQLRPDDPRRKKGKAVKYETPWGSRMQLDINPLARPWLRDMTRPLLITEGSKKADSAISRGLLGIALQGVTGWRGRDDGDAVAELPDWEAIPLKTADGKPRVVYVCFDSDFVQKREVRVALKRLVRFLERRGADVHVIQLPATPGGGKQGLDDFFAAGNTVDELLSLTRSNLKGVDDDERKPSQASRLVDIAGDIELFRTPDGKAFASVPVGNHVENISIKSTSFRDWLAHEFRRTEGTLPGSQAVQDALNDLSGRARFDGKEYEVNVRSAAHADAIYLDLCDAEWRAVRITADGWEVVEARELPVKFRRARGMLALPEPKRGGQLSDLRRFINVRPDDWALVAGWLVAALRPGRPFPVLVLHGEQGSAKSTTARILRSLIDPNVAPLRSAPRDERDLMIAAMNGWMICLNNLSSVKTWLSDALCCLSTGGGFATRELHSDDEEVLFDAMRPVMLNVIEELVTRGDLLERSIIVHLPAITDESRLDQEEIDRAFNVTRPYILGALLDAVSMALRNRGTVQLAKRPRMSDFARWCVAAESALGCEPGAFMNAYANNRSTANDLALEASPIAAILIAFAEGVERWTGTAGELLEELSKRVGVERPPEGWPKSPKHLGGILKRLAPNLRALGIDVRSGKDAAREGGTGRRLIQLEVVGKDLSRSSQSSNPACDSGISSDKGGDEQNEQISGLSRRVNANNAACDNRDDSDEPRQAHSCAPVTDDEVTELASRLEFMEGLSRQDADQRARELFNEALAEQNTLE